MLNKVIDLIKRKKKAIVMSCMMGLITLQNAVVTYAGSLGDGASNLSDTTQQEALGLIEVAGLIGLVVAGICVFLNKRDIAIKVLTGTVLGYVIIKYSPQIWSAITSGV